MGYLDDMSVGGHLLCAAGTRESLETSSTDNNPR